MELDDLKLAWKQLDARIDAQGALTKRLWREAKIDRLRRAAGFVAWEQAIMLAVWIGVAVIAAPFWIEHRATPHLLVAGLVMHGYAIVAIVFCARQLLAVATIRYDSPVVTLQTKLACLRRERLRAQLVLGLPWWVLWVVGTVVGAKRFAGVDLYAAAPSWIWVAISIGIVGMGLTLWLPLRFAHTPGGTRFIERRLNDLTGHSLVRAGQELDELARFERE